MGGEVLGTGVLVVVATPRELERLKELLGVARKVEAVRLRPVEDVGGDKRLPGLMADHSASGRSDQGAFDIDRVFVFEWMHSPAGGEALLTEVLTERHPP